MSLNNFLLFCLPCCLFDMASTMCIIFALLLCCNCPSFVHKHMYTVPVDGHQEQESAKQEASKSSAWKAYMAEVKSYEAKNCSDTEGFKRPLVK